MIGHHDTPLGAEFVTRTLATIVSATMAVASVDGRPARSEPQTPTFRAGVDLVAVEVQVVDADGQPLTSIATDKFDVTIDGRKRRVVSADLVRRAPAAAGYNRSPGAGPVASNEWPVPEGEGRTFVLAIDASSFGPGEALSIVEAARGFLERVQPSDRVGLFTLATAGPKLEPTTDRAKIRHALDSVTGQMQTVPGRFNLSVSEIIDITAETSGLGSPISAMQSAGSSRGVPAPVAETTALQRVQLRECRQTTDMACLEAIVSEASALARHLEERVLQSLDGLAALLDFLSSSPDRKTIILLSGGMAVSDRPGGQVNVGDEAKQLGEQAAHANATIYALHVDSGLSQALGAQSQRPRDATTLERERRLSSKLLEEFADASGGTVLSVLVGNGDIALDRVLRETSSFYLLGVEPTSTDRDGRAHRLNVKVNARGATVRSRQWVVLRPSGR
jgi:VWFA-related protein